MARKNRSSAGQSMRQKIEKNETIIIIIYSYLSRDIPTDLSVFLQGALTKYIIECVDVALRISGGAEFHLTADKYDSECKPKRRETLGTK